MKAHILFDDTGLVGAILHIKEKASEKQIACGFSPGPGHHTAILDIPAELHHLKPRELHDSVRVELSDHSPRLVAKKK